MMPDPAFKPGDKVEVLHRGRPTGRFGIVREVHESAGCLTADEIGGDPLTALLPEDCHPFYDRIDQFRPANPPSPRLIDWVLSLGLATGHADTEQDLLDHVGDQIRELQLAQADFLKRD